MSKTWVDHYSRRRATHLGCDDGAGADVGVTRAQQSLHLSWCKARKRAGEKVACQPSRFIAELAQEDLRYSNAPHTQAEAAQEKVQGNARLQSLKAMLSR